VISAAGILRASLIGATFAALTLAFAPSAGAADADDFDAGSLISDDLFFDGDAMSAVEIDAFIDAKNPGCATNRTCLENYREDVEARAATSRCDAIPGRTNQTAGQIIAAVANACDLSPKAILVILQKEQSLVSAMAPSSYAFAYAMGAGCPDSTGCDTPNQGLYRQVYYGASLLKWYTQPSSSVYTRYQAGRTSHIQYDVPVSCGTKSVAVRNEATHALYVYTPYTPNQAALDNLYGTGDSCSAYGNRNFWRLFTDWFGDTQSTGANAIDQLYFQLGGDGGELGSRTSEVIAVAGGVYLELEHGMITWTEAKGAVVIPEQIAASYLSNGGPTGAYGWPIDIARDTTKGGGGVRQDFENGIYTYSNSADRIIVITGRLMDAFRDNGGVAKLGWPIAGRQFDSTSRLIYQKFQEVVAIDAGPRQTVVANEFADVFFSTGGPLGPMKWPTSSVTEDTAFGGGVRQDFANGIYTYPTRSERVIVINGRLASAFDDLGGVRALGWPVAGRQRDSDAGVSFQRFRAGVLIDNGDGFAVVANEFYEGYLRSGGPDGSYGWPETPVYRPGIYGGGVRQDFDNGIYTYPKRSGRIIVVTGRLAEAYKSFGGVSGGLGWPIAGRQVDAASGLSFQKFVNGRLFDDGSEQGWVAHEFAAAFLAGGGFDGTWGSPLGPPETQPDGDGVWQQFSAHVAVYTPESGSVLLLEGAFGEALVQSLQSGASVGWPTAAAAWDPALGAETMPTTTGFLVLSSGTVHFVGANFYDGYAALGGVSGSLGVPDGPVTGGAAQQFQVFTGGTLAWSASHGAFQLSPALVSAFGSAAELLDRRGWPEGEELVIEQRGGGVSQAFANAIVMYVNSQSEVRVVRGTFVDAYESYGGIDSLGWPDAARTSHDLAGVLFQKFELGVIIEDDSRTAVVAPELHLAYLDSGGPSGPYGWPTSPIYRSSFNGGGIRQDFEGGIRTFPYRSDRTIVITGRFVDAFIAAGGVTNGLGWPIAGRQSVAIAGDHVLAYQKFDRGTLFDNGVRVGLVDNALRDSYFEEWDGPWGPLGWPVGDPAVTSGGVQQDFDSGGMAWSEALGIVVTLD
jgi:uncharacterized protein with LGFP repeats